MSLVQLTNSPWDEQRQAAGGGRGDQEDFCRTRKGLSAFCSNYATLAPFFEVGTDMKAVFKHLFGLDTGTGHPHQEF